MIELSGATGDQETLIRSVFTRLFYQDNLTSATSSEPVSLFGGDAIPSLTTELTSGNQSDGHNPILVLSEKIEIIESIKAKYYTSTLLGCITNKNTANKHLSDFVEAIKVAPAKVNQKYLLVDGGKFYGEINEDGQYHGYGIYVSERGNLY